MPGDIVFGCLPVLFAIAIAITFTKDSGTAGLSAFVGWIVFNAIQAAFILTNKNPDGVITSYNFLWYNLAPEKYDAIFTSNVGIQSLSTSVFGGIAVGFVVAFLYNKFKDIRLPTVIGFFSGVRFIPIVTFGASLVLGLCFAIV
jgi:PTS system glucose-specific IIC component